MNGIIGKTWGLCVALLMSANATLRAEDYVLDFSTKQGTASGYVTTSEWTAGEMDWELQGGYNNKGLWDYVRFGGKGKTDGVAHIRNKQPMPMAVGELLLDVKALNGVAKTTAFKLFVAEDEGMETVIDVVSHAKGEGILSFMPKDVEVWPAQAYYKLEIYWSNNKSTNKGIDITALTFKQGVPPPVYTVTAMVNDGALGTVSVDGKKITVSREACTTYADPAYTLLEGDAELTQDGDVFTVAPQSDCSIQINLTPIEIYSVLLDAGSGTLPGANELLQTDCTEPVVLPEAVSPCADWTFAGWATEGLAEATDMRPELLPAGDYLPEKDIILYAVYCKQEQGDGGTGQLTMRFNATVGWDVQVEHTGGGETVPPYYILHEGAAICSPVFDLSTILAVSATVRSYHNKNTVIVTDEQGKEWGRITAGSDQLIQTDGVKRQDLAGTGRLRLTGADPTPAWGVGVSAVTITCRTAPVLYHTTPVCEPGSGTGLEQPAGLPPFYVEGNMLCWHAAGDGSLEVYDVTGQLLSRVQTMAGENRLALPSGVSLLRTEDGTVHKVTVR